MLSRLWDAVAAPIVFLAEICYNSLMMQRVLLGLLFVSSLCLTGWSVDTAAAATVRQLEVSTGADLSMEQIVTNIVTFLADLIVYLCVALFMVGAFFLVISQGDGDNFTRGKELIIGSLIGLAVTLGAAAIIRTVYYFFYSA